MIKRWDTFIASVFFVLGFSVVFSLVGALLQSVLSYSPYAIQLWLGRAGGIVIILFGLYVLGLLDFGFLQKEHKFRVLHRFSSVYAASFVFGAAFAVGWTPCVSAALGAILTLAAVQPGSAFFLLFAYTLGLGIPFLIVGLFAQQAQQWITGVGPWLRYIQYVFGAILVIVGILMFTSQLALVANFEFLVRIVSSFDGIANGATITSLNPFSLAIAFIAGLASFLSPCVLPIVPGFLSYLASTALRNK